MSDMKLFNADGEVHVGDVVRYGGKPYFVDGWRDGQVSIVSMCERKYTLRVMPYQIGCLFGKGE
jgi:hypothetical protein